MYDPQDRQLRVFISSTFRDMGAERDHLVKFIFPQLRKLCESRGVTWGEVDLRWGVTDEAAAEGHVLPICLEEIKRCRPYFIGILGERYGWVPESIPEDLIGSEPWLRKYTDKHKSITELEILHGVLEDPKMAGHAYFYLRDPAYLDNLPVGAKRGDFTAEDAESQEKLGRLKQQIAGSGFPVRENYADPKALGELVLADLTKVINDAWPEGSQLDPLDREAMDHEAFAQSRAKVYIGRDEYFQKLDACAARSDGQPLVVLGESGSGKSALLANWALKHRAAHPDSIVLLHFIGGTPYSTYWAAMLRRIMGEFKRKLGIAQEIPDQPDALRSAFANWLHMAAAKGRIILILDGLNQLEDRDGAPDLVWLPPVMPENVRLILSTLPGRSLDEINKRKWSVLEVRALSLAERQQFITDYLKLYTKTLSPARAARIASVPQSSNPLYLRALLEELRIFGEHERLDDRIGHYLTATTVPELYERILARWEADYEGDTDLVGDAMSLLWAARRGLTETELLDALGAPNAQGEHEPLPRAQWSPLFLAAGDSLVSRSGLLTFFHDHLRDAVRNAYIPTEMHQHAAHLRLADCFMPQAINPPEFKELPLKDRLWLDDLFRKSRLSPRLLDELPWQLTEAAAWARLYALLSDLSFIDALRQASKLDARVCWARLEDNAFLTVDAYRPLLESPNQFLSGYVWGLAGLLYDLGHPAEALILQAYLAASYRESGEDLSLAGTLGNRALILHARGNIDEAVTLFKEQAQISRDRGDQNGLANALNNQGVVLLDRGDLDCAMTHFKQAEEISRELGDNSGLGAALGNQALIHSAQGNLDLSMTLLTQSARICRELDDKVGLGASLGNQAKVCYIRGDLDAARVLYEQQEQICRELGDKAGLATSHGNQAVILQGRGDLERALALRKQQEQICRELGNKDGIQSSLSGQAEILRARGDIHGAMTLQVQTEQICRELGDKKGLLMSFVFQGLALQDLGDLDGALALHRQAEELSRELGDKDGLQASLGNQGIILKVRGDLNGAMDLFKRAERICREVGIKKSLGSSLGNQALILKFQGDFEGAMALDKQVEQISREMGDVESLAVSLLNQALLLALDVATRPQALPLAEQACLIAMNHGLISLTEKFTPLLIKIRLAARGG